MTMKLNPEVVNVKYFSPVQNEIILSKILWNQEKLKGLSDSVSILWLNCFIFFIHRYHK